MEFYLYDWCVIDVHILVQFVNTYILSTFVLRIEYVLVFTSTQKGILKIAKTYFSKHQKTFTILIKFCFAFYSWYTYIFVHSFTTSLFRNKRFVLDEIYAYKNLNLIFPFFNLYYFIFFPNECPSLCRHRPGHAH